MSRISEALTTSGIVFPIFLILFGTSSRCFYLGWTNYDQCPFLPQGLIGFGLIGSICSIVALFLVDRIFSSFSSEMNREC